MYRFKGGENAGRTLTQVLLRDASIWVWFESWAEDKPALRKALKEFNRLRRKLRRAPIRAKCYGRDCKRRAKWMTLPLYYRGGYLPRPYFWCDKHEPWEESGISGKLPIHFDVVKVLKDKLGQKQIHRRIREAMGIPKGTKITEKFAKEFFANLPQSPSN
ncbi:MAG: hypothetical protein ABSG54_12275 [Terriglobia bacterium]|jgi:hypothetical protein